ncbi:hypothetical protein FE257_011641 [Aspergillus nanangensis]|uniref:Heterokaryon incompatibility domain-containing protein n=1 Tax=Aspergillus nanangensis TaxID=2582783 RepID=A0AAD4GZ21_ASPNN|nr:hypothetical protein FE257_011641 [Aspergillus nanangensis]
MLYHHLPLGPNQIRLLTIQPVAPSDNASPIHCKLDLVDLPAKQTLRPNNIPANYIDCEDWVTRPRWEEAREELLQNLRDALDEKQSRVYRVVRPMANRLFRLFGEPQINRDDIFWSILHLMDRMGPDEYYWATLNGYKLKTAWPIDSRDNRRPPEKCYTARVPLDTLPRFYYPRAEYPVHEAARDSNNYLAMSYAWGDPDGPRDTIFVNGQPIEIRGNLAAGLRQFRQMEYFQRGGKIWIDALCINQDDPVEKAVQVQRMGEIYQKAGNIIVWLGESEDFSGQAIDELEHLSKMKRNEFLEIFDNADPILATTWRNINFLRTMVQLQRLTQGGEPSEHEPERRMVMQAIHRFFDRPYWRRLWIIQELVNGRAGMPIVCGSRVTQWRYIRDAAIVYVEVLNSLLDPTSPGALNDHPAFHVANIVKLEIRNHRRQLPEIDENFLLPLRLNPDAGREFQVGSGLREALLLASNADASDAKDRVYGMLHIPSLHRLKVTVDYGKPVGHIYREFAQECLQRGSLRDILFLLDGRETSLPGFDGPIPSWIPDFGASRRSRPGIIEGDWSAGRQNPSESYDFIDVTFGLNPPRFRDDELLLCGFVAAMVVGVGAISPLDLDLDSRPWPTLFQTGVVQPALVKLSDPFMDDILCSMENGYNTSYPWPLDLPETPDGYPEIGTVLVGGTKVGGARGVHGRTGIMTMFHEQPSTIQPDDRNWQFFNSNAEFLIYDRPLKSYTWSGVGDPDPSSLLAAERAMEFRTRNRRLVFTSNGLLGLAPAATQPGDCILILLNHGVPVIARPVGVSFTGVWTTRPRNSPVLAWRMIGECYVGGMMNAQMMPIVSHGNRCPDYFIFR